MGVFAHSTVLYISDKDQGRLIAGAMLKSPHSLVFTPPYGSWMNVYLPLGLSYKDIPELPTSTAIELNCYDSEGLDVRLFTSDRIAFMFESGCGDVGEEEDELLEIASGLWEKEQDGDAEQIEVAAPADGEGDEAVTEKRKKTFWDLSPEDQEKYVSQARSSGEFKKFVDSSTSEDNIPDVAPFAPFLPEGRTLDELQVLLGAIAKRLHGPPTDVKELESIKKWMDGKDHSDNAEDYLQAVANFLDVRGGVWSLEALQEKMADKIDRRIISLDAVSQPQTD
ncbi:hypothetical protein KQI84_10020 [bacterium]|nr:hypothetical protein [bacterium]